MAAVVAAASDLASLLAHQGGWDELLFVLAPLVLVAGLLVSANRRAKRLLAEQQASGPQTGDERASEERAAEPGPTGGAEH